MAVAIASTIVAKVGGNVYAIATGQSATALAPYEVASDAPVAMTWTGGDVAVATATADVGNIGRAIYNADTFEFYIITAAFAGVAYVIDRAYVGTPGANAFDSVVFTPTTASVAGQSGRVWSGVL